MRRRGQTGQASVEIVGVAIGLAVLALVGWQTLVAAGTWQTTQHAARVAARAGQVGAPAKQAALAALPDRLAKRATVTTIETNSVRRVRVSVPVPVVLDWVTGLGRVSSEAEILP